MATADKLDLIISTLNTVAGNVNELKAAVAGLETAGAVRQQRLEQLTTDVARHEGILEGNGKPGLKQEIAVIQSRLQTLTVLVAVVGTPTAGAIVTLLFGILTHQITIGQ